MFKAPFSFRGRIRRLEYGLSVLAYTALIFTFNILAGSEDVASLLVVLLLYVPLVWFLWAQGAKRCHDKDRSGWFQIIPFYFLVLIFNDGDPYTNRFGRSPKGKEEPQANFFEEEPALEA
ncbi:DUF805 domain-containing protein [Rufibacter hautae]|uniref:DUF805 domain-containing protein n=1 Tax=Rufibacter hautae TaxID=2595005 RepID=A0A5B6TCZ1_9BACT|nr:DUF805 domain-containing protein [Rufibacter hautae]KAA3436849.1 DUF805 domain-containing protein [Rufibacter hautae]